MKPTYLQEIEKATGRGREELFRLGTAVLFLVAILVLTGDYVPDVPNAILLVAAAVIGGYMALNIGANDVANNVGPAVGSRALSITGAILIAALFEATGAIVAGGDVVGTVKNGIIDPALIDNSDEFIWMMMAALLSASIWLNIATYTGTPVSTTHSIVGGVLGAGLAAGGPQVADWAKVAAIVASWIISPLIGGVIAAGTLLLIKRLVTYQEDRIAAACQVVPWLIAVMGWAFTTYLLLKGLKKIVIIEFPAAALLGLLVGALVYLLARRAVFRSSATLANDQQGISELFTLPLVFSAALLSFAHGANDVANAVGPLAAINEAVHTATVAAEADIPLWVMLIGACGIALGLALYGPKLIRVVGSEITELNQMRAYCVALAAAVTVILASQLGLPVSSTHVAVGAVFGVGFLRESIKMRFAARLEDIRAHHRNNGSSDELLNAYLARFEQASFAQQGVMLTKLKAQMSAAGLTRQEQKMLKKTHRRQLVARSAIYRIVAAWVITVPVAGASGAIFYFTLRGIMLE